MNLVIDASVLVGQLLRPKGHELIKRPELSLYVASKMVEETNYEVRRRIAIMLSQDRLNEMTANLLLETATDLMQTHIKRRDRTFYASFETEAKKRIPRDPNDWETVALALALSVAIWTEDYDFFGCGCATWTTETLRLQLQ